MDIKEIQKFISSKGIDCESEDFFFDSENTLCFHVDDDNINPIYTISKSKTKSFENQIKRKFKLERFNIIFTRKKSDSGLIEIFKKHKVEKKDFKIFYLEDSSVKLYLDRTVQHLKEIKADIKSLDIKCDIIVENIEEMYKLPSKLAILRVIKKKAPIKFNTIRDDLQEKGFLSRENLLKNKLDEMRKKDMIIHTEGQYILTGKGLSILPITKDRYHSSDIERALELGKRKW